MGPEGSRDCCTNEVSFAGVDNEVCWRDGLLSWSWRTESEALSIVDDEVDFAYILTSLGISRSVFHLAGVAFFLRSFTKVFFLKSWRPLSMTIWIPVICSCRLVAAQKGLKSIITSQFKIFLNMASWEFWIIKSFNIWTLVSEIRGRRHSPFDCVVYNSRTGWYRSIGASMVCSS